METETKGIAMAGSEKRDSYMDFLKGIAILSVIAGHTVAGVQKADMLFQIIYSFHMPLLFFVSAYIEEQNKAKYVGKEGKLLLRRMWALLLPYVSWTVIYAAVSGHLSETGIAGLFSEIFGYKSNGLWFFPVLFGLKIMHVLYRMICNRFKRQRLAADLAVWTGLEIVLALLVVLTKQPYLINMLSYAIPYFFGVMLAGHEKVQEMLRHEWLTAGAMLAYVLIFPHFSFYDTHWMTQVIRIGLSLCVIVICLRGKERWKITPFYKLVCIYGEYSLAIYVLHGYLTDYAGYFANIDSAAVVMILAVAAAVIVAAVCVAFARIVEISSWWKRILLGK